MGSPFPLRSGPTMLLCQSEGIRPSAVMSLHRLDNLSTCGAQYLSGRTPDSIEGALVKSPLLPFRSLEIQ